MKLSLSALFLYASSATAVVNRTLTNGFGSTPAERHYITHAQALTVIQAGIKFSEYVNLSATTTLY